MNLADGYTKKVAIVGAGISGSLTAWHLQQLGCEIHIYEPDEHKKSCSFTAAGMLAPMAELESANDHIYQLGMHSIALWPQIIAALGGNIFHRDNGTLVVCHRQDEGVFNQLLSTLKNKLGGNFSQQCEVVHSQSLERELKPLGTSLLLQNEAQVDAHQALNALHQSLKSNSHWHARKADKLSAYKVNDETFDWVFDCRGLAAKHDINGLHGVRGEVITVHAPQVNIERMVRVMHPRYRIYIVPRENQKYMIGATEIQSDDTGPMSVRSTLELLSAAFSVHSGFAEARILGLDTNVRPATLDHQPVIDHQAGLTRINGLYRHGYLLAPAVVAKALQELGFNTQQHLMQAEYENCI
ncbi:glycine oxidase ThiO [Oceaniserpentilla sp. 4NH20-0058]|uniref:FAD-dependent oxidoreductase n=1 Tax=Oceaniserpentilla sp. 4NH20-0058 TaxID=3127660 RepID=UPI0031097983